MIQKSLASHNSGIAGSQPRDEQLLWQEFLVRFFSNEKMNKDLNRNLISVVKEDIELKPPNLFSFRKFTLER